MDSDGIIARARMVDMLEIRYVTVEGAGGSTRETIAGLVAWLEKRPGTLIVGLRNLDEEARARARGMRREGSEGAGA